MEKENLISLQQNVLKLRVEGKYEETIEACFQLLEAGLAANDPKSILTAHINNAASFYSIGAIEEAFHSIDAHLDYSTDNGDDADRLNGYNVLFLLHEYTKDYEKAKGTLEKAIELGKNLGHFNIVSNAYSNYSDLLADENNFESALSMAKTGLEMAKLHEPRTPILEFRVKLNIANALIGLEELKDAEQLVTEMINDPLLESFIREKTQVHDLYGRFLLKKKKYREALQAYDTAKELAESYNDRNLLKGILEKRCKLCDLMDDVQRGYKAQQEYINLLSDLRQYEVAMAAVKIGVKHRYSTIERRANTDFLTGLYNRSYTETTTNKWLAEAAHTGESIVCIAFDLDNLKSLNDTYGHIFGDKIIKEIGQQCARQIRSDDLMGRFGGDEFAIILRNLTLEAAQQKAENLLEAVRSIKIEKDGIYISLTASVGIADNANGTIQTFTELFHQADVALYQAKEGGKNRICITS
ncbi:diguanylate cyclase [Sporosarcina luteola]|uniref:tetratricopeptide repeat-containing diguanylate cyclase n=1 Tax=Sporosarcina luteola TaxID=582850 RepID=UPI00203D6C6E|nr:tetratricopeptide repeat-containing diguanylate cyclase [Sporosarcina luteola]MCM3743989.1 diguanylate cyclase [Sporosarcina luteola]